MKDESNNKNVREPSNGYNKTEKYKNEQWNNEQS